MNTESEQPDIKLYSFSATDRNDLSRVVDLNGDWKHYYHPPTGRYVPAVNAVLHAGYPKDERFHQYLLSVSKDEAKHILETAGERGSRVHRAIELLEEGRTLTYAQLMPNALTGRPEPLSQSEWKCLLAWSQFLTDWSVSILPCHHAVLGVDYAGTLDDVLQVTVPASSRSYSALVGKRITVLIDYKTSSGIYDEYGAQTAAYFFGDSPSDIGYTGILRLGTLHKNGPVDGAGYEVRLWNRTETKQNYGDFRAAHRFWRKNTKQFSADDMKASMPLSLQVSVPTDNQAPLPLVPTAPSVSSTATGNGVTKHVRNKLQDKQTDGKGVQTGAGGVLSGSTRGHKAGGKRVSGEKGNKATVPVSHH